MLVDERFARTTGDGIAAGAAIGHVKDRTIGLGCGLGCLLLVGENLRATHRCGECQPVRFMVDRWGIACR